VTQSTLSSGIFALERQLDAALLERTGGKRPVFTPLGRELVGRARAALAALTVLAFLRMRHMLASPVMPQAKQDQ